MKTNLALLALFLACVGVWVYNEAKTLADVRHELSTYQYKQSEGALTGQDIQPAKAFPYRDFKYLIKE